MVQYYEISDLAMAKVEKVNIAKQHMSAEYFLKTFPIFSANPIFSSVAVVPVELGPASPSTSALGLDTTS